MKCIIAEKPSVAQSIAKIVGATKRNDGYLEGSDYLVTWAYGHLITLAMPDSYGWGTYDRSLLPMLPSNFKHIVRLVKNGKEWKSDPTAHKQLKVIKSCFNNCTSIIVATDAGREGELIFRYIYNFLGCKKPYERLWISSLTDRAIKEGLQQLKQGSDFNSLYEAGRLRSEADWLVGMNGSRAMSIVQKGVYSVGRVQTPTLCMVCERYEENQNFKSVPFWRLKCQVLDSNGQYTALGVERYEEKAKADDLLVRLQSGSKGFVQDISIKENSTPPPLLFDLTALQKEANKRYDLSADQTLKIAQSLYEKKLITYPRTGSCYISEDVYEEIPQLLTSLSGHPVYGRFISGILNAGPNKRSVNATKVTDHHALLPTGENADTLLSDEAKVYDLIVKRMLEAFSGNCLSESYLCQIKSGEVIFELRLKSIKVFGWKEIGRVDRIEKTQSGDDISSDNEEIEVSQFPAFETGKECSLRDFTLTESKTKPQPLYTEATLLSAMEHAGQKIEDEAMRSALTGIGIGTPATRAGIIETLIQRGYMVRNKKALVPTDKGLFLYHNLRNTALGNVSLTGKWENALSQIEDGKSSPETFEAGIKEFTKQITSELLAIPANTTSGCNERKLGESITAVCPKCNSPLAIYPKLVKCRGCDFKVWREICGVKLQEEQLTELISTGQLKNVDGFKSKKGNTFSADLRMNLEDGKVEFVFNNKEQSDN